MIEARAPLQAETTMPPRAGYSGYQSVGASSDPASWEVSNGLPTPPVELAELAAKQPDDSSILEDN